MNFPLSHSWNFGLAILMAIAVWTEWFLVPLSIYLALMLNPEIPRTSRGWTWVVIGLAVISYVVSNRLMRV